MSKHNKRAVQRPAEGLIALLSLLFVLFLFGPWLINAPPVDNDHPFNTEATFERLERILGDEAPHPVDSDQSDRVIERLVGEIRALGFEPRVDEAFQCNKSWNTACAQVRNIGFWVTEPGPNAVMVASHHDSVPTGPGAADDGMGVAASLEIARLMRGRDLPRPLYILITDGEEIGLVGAARFVKHDPVAPMIGAVVSLEARGNRGAASMFETSDPNSRDLASLHPHPERRTRGPVSNSLTVDIYRAMPNGTDVTEYLTLGMDASNLAVTGHYAHYHTRHDTIGNLNDRAVFHMGVSALSAVEGLMTVDPDAPEANRIYGDVLGLFILSLPQSWGLPLVILTLLACGVALFRTDRAAAPLWRVLLMPVVILIGGTGLAYLSNLGVAAIRPESDYGQAYPIALRGLFLSLSLLVAVVAARWLYRPDGASRYLAGAWFILMVLGLAATYAFPGAVVLFALPACLVLPATLLLIARQKLAAKIVYALAAILTLTQLLSLHVGAETALFIETSAPLTMMILWMFLICLPLFWTRAGFIRRPVIGAGVAAIGFGIAALFVPAYSAESPMGANLYHITDGNNESGVLAVSGRNPLPESVSEVAPFTRGDVEDFSRNLWVTPVAAPTLSKPGYVILKNEVEGDDRIIRLRFDAPDADRVELRAVSNRPDVEVLQINGFVFPDPRPDLSLIECSGRTCRTLEVEIRLPSGLERLDLQLWSVAWGMGPVGQPFDAARPNWTGPQHDGDRRILRRTFRIPVQGAESTPSDE